MNRFLVRSLLLVCVSIIVACLTGCANVNTYVLDNDDGTISEIVEVSLDEKVIRDTSYSLVDMKADIQEVAVNAVDKIRTDLNTRASGANRPDLVDGIELKESEWRGNSITIEVVFKNEDVYWFYLYNTTDASGAQPTITDTFWYTEMRYDSKPTLRRGREYAVYDELFTYFATKYPDLIDSTSNRLSYSYVADFRRIHTNADEVYYKDGKYINVWVLDKVFSSSGHLSGYDPNKEVTIYYRIAHQANWVMASLLIGLSLTVIILLIYLIAVLVDINKNNKKLLNNLLKRLNNKKKS